MNCCCYRPMEPGNTPVSFRKPPHTASAPRPWRVAACCLVLVFAQVGHVVAQSDATLKPTGDKATQEPDDRLPAAPKLGKVQWKGPARSLLPQSGLGDWEAISFGGEGDCRIEDSVLIIESGDPMSGVCLSEDVPLPTTNYEISLEARRTGGIDFFCGLTFPVQDTHCCLIVAGWAGAVVGLSNIDDEDASTNASRQLMSFEDNQWYRIRLRVMPERLIAWIDDRCVIDQDIRGKKISLRGDTLSTRPLGICTFQTTSEIRKFKIRSFADPRKQDHVPSNEHGKRP